MTFFLIFPIKQVLTFHEIVSTEDNLHGMSNPVETICMKPVFREKKKKKKDFKMLSAENFIESSKP